MTSSITSTTELFLSDETISWEINTNNSSTNSNEISSGIIFFACIHAVLLIGILSGNILTILAIRCSRKLRSITSNVFIRSLAISDIMVGFTLPYHIAFYLSSGLGDVKQLCLARFFLIIMACCVSIYNLVAIAIDRYTAIVYPLHYNRYITKRVALIIIAIGWVISITISSIPMFWNNYQIENECEFDEVLPKNYMLGVVTPIFSTIWICMLLLYTRIWREASKHLKQLRTSSCGLNYERHSDWKSVQVVLLILGSFTVCWLPYFIIACSQICDIFGSENSSTIYRIAFALAMSNSVINPIIYAWKNQNFRRAFGRLLRCQWPDVHEMSPIAIRSKSIQNNNAEQNNKKKIMSDILSGEKIKVTTLTPPVIQRNLTKTTVTAVIIDIDTKNNQTIIEKGLELIQNNDTIGSKREITVTIKNEFSDHVCSTAIDESENKQKK